MRFMFDFLLINEVRLNYKHYHSVATDDSLILQRDDISHISKVTLFFHFLTFFSLLAQITANSNHSNVISTELAQFLLFFVNL